MLSKSRNFSQLLLLFCLSLLGIALCIFGANKAFSQVKQDANPTKIASLAVSGPFTSGNLAVYLIHGQNQSNYQKFLTLNEAMLKGKVVVHETGNVNELAVENLGNVAVFIQSGEIVKGGKQDRTLQYDMILPPKSGKVPIKSFCVESGRWRKRGGESSKRFAKAPNMIASKKLKMATKSKPSQRKVWDAVKSFQGKYSSKGYRSVRNGASPSSLQLSLESKAVKNLSQKYVKELKPVAKNKKNAIGYAFAINGELNSADVYNSNILFQKLWPKLILASAQEAAAEEQKGKSFTPPVSSKVLGYLKTNKQGKESRKKISKNNLFIKRESKKSLFSETQDSKKGKWVHRNYLTK